MRIVYSSAARKETVEAARYYQDQSPGLGAQFLEAVDAAVRQIVNAPGRWQHIDGDIQRFVMRRFPFTVIYRVAGDTVRILAIHHSSRNPNSWRERL